MPDVVGGSTLPFRLIHNATAELTVTLALEIQSLFWLFLTILSIHGLAVDAMLNPGAQLTPVPCLRQKCRPIDLPKSLSTKTLQGNRRLKYQSDGILLGLRKTQAKNKTFF